MGGTAGNEMARRYAAEYARCVRAGVNPEAARDKVEAALSEYGEYPGMSADATRLIEEALYADEALSR
jgi:hypothetical protein